MNDQKTFSLSKELEVARFGDKRLEKRLSKVVDCAARRPGKSFPGISNSIAELEATYRFLSNPKVTPEGILSGHFEATVKRAAQAERTIVAHDTTDFIFGGQEPRDGLGWVTNDNQGFRAHFALALARKTFVYPLGVLGFETIFRTGKSKGPNGGKKRSGPSEFARWWSLAHSAEHLLSEGTRPVHVMDREADSFDLLSELAGQNMRFVIRVKYDRNDCKNSETREQGKLSELFETEEVLCERDVKISRRDASRFPQDRKVYGSRSARAAKLNVSALKIEIPRPATASESYPQQLTLNCVYVREADAPKGVEPVQWKLLTQESIDTEEDILNIIDDYRARWTIEEYFKALKSGCSFAKRQLEGKAALLNALAVFIPVAWQLLLLRTLNKHEPDLPATYILTESQIAVLTEVSKKDLNENPTIAEALTAIARLGGHIPNNGAPGWQVLSRGMEDLLLMELGWNAAKGKM